MTNIERRVVVVKASKKEAPEPQSLDSEEWMDCTLLTEFSLFVIEIV